MKEILDFRKMLDSLATGVFAVDTELNIIHFNEEAVKITGFTKKEAIGRKCYEIFRTALCLEGCYLRKAIEMGTKIIKVRNWILNKKNREIPVDITAAVLRDDKGHVLGGVESFLDDSVRVTLEKKINGSYTFQDIVGNDEKIIRLFDLLGSVAKTDAHVLLLGDTGTGKDLFARAIHNASHRKEGPFVKVNCAALPPPLLESELFGYKKGAFTDAKQDKPGRFQTAEGGTIFLDEIGELSRDLQAKLLQVLDEKEFYPLGSTQPVKVNVRVISSTNRKLTKMTRERDFREDLYYRLRVVEAEIPPLRERPTDIPLLIDHFLKEQTCILGKQISEVTPGVMKILLNYRYPGNVRELKNIIEHAVIIVRGGKIDTDALPMYLFEQQDVQMLHHGVGEKNRMGQTAPLAVLEKDGLLEVLRSHDWNRGETARTLRINRTTLWRKMKKHNLLPKQTS